jgi:hypothetical protein
MKTKILVGAAGTIVTVGYFNTLKVKKQFIQNKVEKMEMQRYRILKPMVEVSGKIEGLGKGDLAKAVTAVDGDLEVQAFTDNNRDLEVIGTLEDTIIFEIQNEGSVAFTFERVFGELETIIEEFEGSDNDLEMTSYDNDDVLIELNLGDLSKDCGNNSNQVGVQLETIMEEFEGSGNDLEMTLINLDDDDLSKESGNNSDETLQDVDTSCDDRSEQDQDQDLTFIEQATLDETEIKFEDMCNENIINPEAKEENIIDFHTTPDDLEKANKSQKKDEINQSQFKSPSSKNIIDQNDIEPQSLDLILLNSENSNDFYHNGTEIKYFIQKPIKNVLLNNQFCGVKYEAKFGSVVPNVKGGGSVVPNVKGGPKVISCVQEKETRMVHFNKPRNVSVGIKALVKKFQGSEGSD